MVPMALVDDGLEVEMREELAAAIYREVLAWDGEKFPRIEVMQPSPNLASGDLYWLAGKPSLSSFVAAESLNIFHLIGLGAEDLQWLAQPVVEWENSLKFMEFANYVKTKLVVNDPAERALGLIKPIIKKFKKEKNLQSAMIVTKKARAAWPAKKNCSMNKTELNKIKPSELLRREEDIADDSTDDEDMANPGDMLDI